MMSDVVTHLTGLLVPTRVLKAVAALCAPPGGMADPRITGCPDSWLPPYWLSLDQLGDEHPAKRVRVTAADIARDNPVRYW